MKKLTITIIFLLALTVTVSAQEPSKYAGTSSNIFLRAGLSTRVSGLGEAFTAVSDDENALFYNPAGLANISQGAVGLNHTQWFEDIKMDNLVFGYNFDNKLGVGISVAHMWMPAIQGKDNFGNPTGDINVSSSIINLGLGYKIHPSLYLGIGLKYFQDNLADFSVNGVALDAGLYMYTAIRGMTFGVSVQNLGGNIQYDQVQEKIPFSYRAGLAYKISGSGFRLAVDAVKSRDNDIAIGAGLEYTLMEAFSLRFGNQFRQDRKFQPGYGAGLNISDKYVIDYTYYAFEDLGNTHRVGFTFKFDLPGTNYRSKSVYTRASSIVTRSRPPVSVTYALNRDKLVLNWSRVYGAEYNVYAKTGTEGPWQKLNSSQIKETKLEFKKPSGSNEIYFSVTSVINNVESAFSKEVKVEAK
ncbi:MAG: PorV/PorQ family protein [Calditrichaeota bacterium]|nr:PorV/PorQ family protein [Calditrichota bacterium]